MTVPISFSTTTESYSSGFIYIIYNNRTWLFLGVYIELLEAIMLWRKCRYTWIAEGEYVITYIYYYDIYEDVNR